MVKFKNSINVLAFKFAVTLLFAGCSFTSRDLGYQRGQGAAKAGNYKLAINEFAKVVKRDPNSESAIKAAREGARLAVLQTKDFAQAIDFYTFLVLHSKDADERAQAQYEIGQIYFENFNNYDQAIIEFNKLSRKQISPELYKNLKMGVARAYFYQKNFYQAKVEVQELLGQNIPDRTRFEATLFLGNTYLAEKNQAEALKTFTDLQKKFPDLAREEKLGITISVCYEDLGSYDKAIQVLQEMKKTYEDPDFLELKIRRLRERKANMPGALGLRK